MPKNTCSCCFFLFYLDKRHNISVFTGRIILTKSDIKKMIIAAVTFLVLGSFIFLPLGMFGDAISSLGHGNNDLGIYGAASSIIMHYGYTESMTAASHAFIIIFTSQTRCAVFLVAYFSKIFPLSIWNALDMVFVLSIILIAISGVMLGHVIGKTWLSGIISGALLFFNVGYIYLIQESFFGQITSIPIVITITACVLCQNNDVEKNTKLDFKRASSIGFLVAFVIMIYMEQVPFVGLFLVVVLAVIFIDNKMKGGNLFKEYLVSFVVVAVLYGKGIVSFFRSVTSFASMPSGWSVPAGGTLQALGVYNVYLGTIGAVDFTEWPRLVTIIGSVIFLLLLIMYIIKKYSKLERKVIFSVTVVYAVMYLFFLWKFRSYQTFKGLVNMQYFFIVLFGAMCADGLRQLLCNENKIKLLGICSILLVSFVVVTGFDFYQRLFVQHSKSVPDESVYNYGLFFHEDNDNKQLLEFLSKHNEKIVTIKTYDITDGCEALVAAIEAGIHPNMISDTDGYFRWNESLSPKGENYYNIENNVFRDPIETVGDIVFQNDTFLVKQVNIDYPVCQNRGRVDIDFSIDENGCAVTRKITNTSFYKFVYNAYKEGSYDIKICINSLKQKKLEVRMNEHIIDSINLDTGLNDFLIKNIYFSKGENVLIIKDTDDKELQDVGITKLSVGNVSNDDVNRIKVNACAIPNSRLLALRKRIFKTKYKLGRVLSFEKECENPARIYCTQGFSDSEQTHTWTDGTEATMEFKLKGKFTNLLLNVRYSTYGLQNVIIYANKHIVANYVASGIETKEIIIPKKYIGRNKLLTLNFLLPNAISPATKEMSPDTRLLALAFIDMDIASTSIPFNQKSSIMGFYVVGTMVSFAAKNGNTARAYCGTGISIAEENFTWTDGMEAELKFRIADYEGEQLNLRIHYTTFLPEEHISIFAGKAKIAEYIAQGEELQELIIQPEYIEEDDILELRFVLPDAKSPAELGMSEDERKLSLCLYDLVLDKL